MGRITRRDLERATDVLRSLGSVCADHHGFARAGVALLPGLVPSELTTLSICDLASGRRRVVGNPGEALSARDIAAFDRYFFEHPLVLFHKDHSDGGAHRISDSVPPRAFRRGALYDEYYRRIGIDHAVAVPLFVDGRTLVSFVLNRTGRDFSDDEMALLDWLRGRLGDMYRNVVALQRTIAAVAEMRTIAEADGWALVPLDAQRRIRELPARARMALGGACPGGRLRVGARLPGMIDAWVRRSTAGGAPWLALPPLSLGAPRGRVTLRAVPDATDGGGWTLLVRGQPEQRTTASRGEMPLTRREREILDWVAAGKTDRQIAAIIGASPRTVQKHLEHVYVKLGVENRTAAVMRAARGEAAPQAPAR
jgi:DNA-binding CsgD family transcriptional regulator